MKNTLFRLSGLAVLFMPLTASAGHHPGSTDGPVTNMQVPALDVSQLEAPTTGNALFIIVITVLVIAVIWWMVKNAKK